MDKGEKMLVAVGLWALAFFFLARRSSAAIVDGPGVEISLSGADQAPPMAPESVVKWTGIVQPIAKEFGLQPTDVLAIIWQESNGFAGARGKAGEIGLMQLMPGTAADFGFSVQDLDDPSKNIRAGCTYFAYCKARTRYECDAFAAYNAGVRGALDLGRGKQYASEVLSKIAGKKVNYCT